MVAAFWIVLFLLIGAAGYTILKARGGTDAMSDCSAARLITVVTIFLLGFRLLLAAGDIAAALPVHRPYAKGLFFLYLLVGAGIAAVVRCWHRHNP